MFGDGEIKRLRWIRRDGEENLGRCGQCGLGDGVEYVRRRWLVNGEEYFGCGGGDDSGGEDNKDKTFLERF